MVVALAILTLLFTYVYGAPFGRGFSISRAVIVPASYGGTKNISKGCSGIARRVQLQQALGRLQVELDTSGKIVKNR